MTKDNDDNNNGDGDNKSTPPVNDNIINIADFKNKPKENWPKSIQNKNPDTILGQDKISIVTDAPPRPSPMAKMRRLLLDLTDGTIEIEGFLGLTNSFLAVGDQNGNIKFAAAGGSWKYATDITDKTAEEITDTTPVPPQDAA